jgi:hypothetical protein
LGRIVKTEFLGHLDSPFLGLECFLQPVERPVSDVTDHPRVLTHLAKIDRSEPKNGQSAFFKKMGKTARQMRRQPGVRWVDVCHQLRIYTSDGRPDTGLAKRISDGYEPKSMETRTRLGADPICPTCNHRIALHRNLKEIVLQDKIHGGQGTLAQAIATLKKLEAIADVPAGPHVYSRGGRPAEMGDK